MYSVISHQTNRDEASGGGSGVRLQYIVLVESAKMLIQPNPNPNPYYSGYTFLLCDSASSRKSASRTDDNDSVVRPGGFVRDKTDHLERKAIVDSKASKRKVLPNAITISDSKLTAPPVGTSDTSTNSLVSLPKINAGTLDVWAIVQVRDFVNYISPEKNALLRTSTFGAAW
ncbi:hypothetical protein GALMADRAFT_132674 [Galerina marginata CBS 339.88]|uniref:Uncharacterized protein n=1 Tax=Galerina marginata (strain CBS 339.88) TaxID=685588 RepID=A0A067TUR8_GALM3|nr:hypothetical protein GALMADRAFT_132674 [Galerina marginata CBS 339.88]